MREQNYNASSLIALKGLDPVLKRPGMYIGSTDYRGTHHLVWEALDNAVDEAIAGFGKRIYITIHKDESISIQDEGRGIPCDFNKKENANGVDLVFCTLHAGGKFNESAYKSAAGLHGVGASCVNALSEYLDVTIYKDGIEYHTCYHDNGTKRDEIKKIGPTTKRGTIVRFKPDKKYLPENIFQFDLICDHLNNSACQISGVHFYLKDERTNKSREFYYENGISEYLLSKTENKEAINPMVYWNEMVNDIKVEIAFQFLYNDFSEHIYSFANSVFTSLEGSHVRGYRSGLTKAFNDYASNTKALKGNAKIEGADIREGLAIVVSVRIPERKIQFEGQVKDKLGTPEAATAVESVIYDKMSRYLVENKEYATKIIGKILDAQKARLAARNAKDEIRGKLNKNPEKTTLLLSGKLVPPQSKDYAHNELFIVEGDSAGGSAKKCRDRVHQGLLPLRGKPKNISNDAEDAFMKNEELSTLAYTIGTGTGKDFNLKDLRYNKIIIMTDADTDGAHIQNLLLNFFFLKMRPLIEAGHVYIACPPLYRVFKMVGSKLYEEFVWSDEQLAAAKEKLGSGALISRYKGLGEMNADQLWETTMNPQTRTLVRIDIEDFESAAEKIELFMGKDPSGRSRWINANIDFSDKSDFFMEVKNNG